MLLGKRSRSNSTIKKTTSMTQLTPTTTPTLDLDLNTTTLTPPQLPHQDLLHYHHHHHHHHHEYHLFPFQSHLHQTAPPFLQACNLCNRRLIPGAHDIYMYRGDTAFCSAECRQEQIIQDNNMNNVINQNQNKNKKDSRPLIIPTDQDPNPNPNPFKGNTDSCICGGPVPTCLPRAT